MKLPTATNGSFEANLVKAPDDWPYALPNLYAANIVSIHAQPKVELVGFWHGEYRLAETQIHPGLESARASAKDLFAAGVVKYLMEAGEIVEENNKVQITGEWPQKWQFDQIRDVGVFLCYLQMLLKARNKPEQAQQLRDSITPAWPLTELILVFQQSLRLAREEFRLDLETRKLIDHALKVVKRWLRG